MFAYHLDRLAIVCRPVVNTDDPVIVQRYNRQDFALVPPVGMAVPEGDRDCDPR
jgi:hypothetical protein